MLEADLICREKLDIYTLKHQLPPAYEMQTRNKIPQDKKAYTQVRLEAPCSKM